MMPGMMLFIAVGLIAIFGVGFVLFIIANAGRGREDWFPPQEDPEAQRRRSSDSGTSTGAAPYTTGASADYSDEARTHAVDTDGSRPEREHDHSHQQEGDIDAGDAGSLGGDGGGDGGGGGGGD